MRNFGTVALLAALIFGATSCAHHHRHHAKPPAKVVVSLDREHGDPGIVVIRKARAPHARCWKHARHWHCRR